MEFQSLLNKQVKYEINTPQTIEGYTTFMLKMHKINTLDSSYSQSNISCILECHGDDTKHIFLNPINFSEYYLFLEKFKSRENCLSISEPIELVKDKEVSIPSSLETASDEIKLYFINAMCNNETVKSLFESFVSGVNYANIKHGKTN